MVVVVVVVSGTGDTNLISQTLKPVDFSPGFASSINLQFSVEQSQDALQTGEPSGALPANILMGRTTYFYLINLLLLMARCCVALSLNPNQSYNIHCNLHQWAT